LNSYKETIVILIFFFNQPSYLPLSGQVNKQEPERFLFHFQTLDLKPTHFITGFVFRWIATVYLSMSSSCVSYVANFSGLSIFDRLFGIL
jgi:hypothetical protein